MSAGGERRGSGWTARLGAYAGFRRDAKLFLVTTLVTGAAISLYWIDFNLYLASLGIPRSTIGLIATLSSLASALVAFPASAASDRFGRRSVIGAGVALMALALVGLALTDLVPLLAIGAAVYSMGQQSVFVVSSPFMTEHSEPEHRNELFALQFAIQNVTNIGAAVLGGVIATSLAGALGLDPEGPGTYRIILVLMIGLLVAGLATVALLTDDRPRTTAGPRLVRLGEPAAFPRDPRRPRSRFGVTILDRPRFFRLVFPGFLIAIGAGQVIPFLNLFVQGKFGLDLTSLNAAFALTSLGTVIAILIQPRLARRFGRIASVVLVQAASIPFLVVLGFSPVLWTVILAMAVRNSLMNAGNPIFNAFAMEHVAPAERATLSAAMSVLWSAGWVIAGTWYAFLQATLGFEAGYAVNFVTIIVLYSVATTMYWLWFRASDRPARAAAAA